MSDQPNEMIPRVIVRDDDDAMLIMFALKQYMLGRIEEYTAQAKRPGANQYKLSMLTIEETEYITGLMRAVDAGIVKEACPASEDWDDTEETEDNGKDS